MIRRPVSSSNVASIGWEDGTLEVEFRSGHLYQYDDVPEEEYERLLGAGSVGRYLNAHIIGSFNEHRIK
jgi:hypothetical protein